MNILVHAFHISPNRGSEFSVSWNYVLSMSKYHHLYVIVGGTSDTIGDYSDLEGLKIPNVDFIYPNIGRWFKIVYGLYQKFLWRIGWWTRYIPFRIWNNQVFQQLKLYKDLIPKIDVIHFLSPVGWHEIGYLYKLGKPCIWGPVGGFTNCQKVFYSHYIKLKPIAIKIKNLLNTLSSACSLNLKCAMKKYDIVVANTQDNQHFIESHFKPKKLLYFPENSMRISENEIKNINEVVNKYDVSNKKVECIWCGTLEDRKMPIMLLDIVKRMVHKNRIHVTMVGGGYMKDYICNRVDIEKLSNVITLCGNLPRQEVRNYFCKSHLHLLTSSYEANTTVMFEAMEECVPSIVFDHFGMADLVKDDITGKKITISNYDKMCNDFAAILDELTENPVKLKSWAMNLREDSKQYSADKRVSFFETCYEFAIKNHYDKTTLA